MVRSEGNMSLKNPVTLPGIHPGTVRLVAQRLNHYATQGPLLEISLCIMYWAAQWPSGPIDNTELLHTYVRLPNGITTHDLRVRETENNTRITQRDECDASLNIRILSQQSCNFVQWVVNYELLYATMLQNKRLCYRLL